MSRSKRKDIIKDRPRNQKKSTLYWRKVRRVWKIEVNMIKYQEEIDITSAKEIENDWNYCDYKFFNCGEIYKRK